MAASPPIADLFERYSAVIYRRCRQMLRDHALAEDAVQEVFFRALRAHDQFRGESSPLTWLYSIATKHCLQQIRNTTRRQSKLDTLSAQARAQVVPELLEEGLTLLQILDEQDETTRHVAYLRFVDGMTITEVADVSGVSRKTASKRLARFLEAARTRLTPLPGS